VRRGWGLFPSLFDEFDDGFMMILIGIVFSGLAIGIEAVGVGTVVEQELCGLLVASLCSAEEASIWLSKAACEAGVLRLRVGFIDVGAGIEEIAHDTCIALSGCVHERRMAVAIERVQRGSGSECGFQDCGIFLIDGREESIVGAQLRKSLPRRQRYAQYEEDRERLEHVVSHVDHHV